MLVKLYLFCGHTPRSKDEQKKKEPRPLPTHDVAEKIVDEFSCKIQFAAAYMVCSALTSLVKQTNCLVAIGGYVTQIVHLSSNTNQLAI
jgi:hypothetical protein